MKAKPTFIAAALALCAAVAAPAAGAQVPVAAPGGNAMQLTGSEAVMSMRVDGEILIGLEGEVRDHRITTEKLMPEMKTLIERSIAGWRFEPVKDDAGKPVMAKTYMRITAVARETADKKYNVNIENVRFHDGVKGSELAEAKKEATDKGIEIVQRPKIKYPKMMLDNGVSGAALAHVLLAPDGSVQDAIIVQSAMFNVRGRSKLIDEAIAQMEREALRGVKKMRVKFVPGVDRADPEVNSGSLAIEFMMYGAASQAESERKPGVWRIELRGPMRTASWQVDAAGTRVGISDMDGSEGYVPNAKSPVKPVSGVPTL